MFFGSTWLPLWDEAFDESLGINDAMYWYFQLNVLVAGGGAKLPP